MRVATSPESGSVPVRIARSKPSASRSTTRLVSSSVTVTLGKGEGIVARDLRDEALAHRDRAGHSHLAARRAVVADRRERVVARGHKRPELLDQCAARRGRDDAARRAHENLRADTVFEADHRAADVRGRGAEPRRRGDEAARVGDRDDLVDALAMRPLSHLWDNILPIGPFIRISIGVTGCAADIWRRPP